MNYPKLVRMWQLASADLGIQISAPFLLTLPSGNRIEGALRVNHFGAEKGTLIFGKYSEVSSFAEEIVQEGYGYSILDEPADENRYSDDKYPKEVFIEMLREWEWTGIEIQKPIWL